MRAGIATVAIWIAFAAVFGGASVAAAKAIVEQPWDGSLYPALASEGLDNHSEIYSPFRMAIDGERVEQILWWGSSSSNEFTIRLVGSLAPTDDRDYPDILSPLFEVTTTASSITVGSFTDLFSIELPVPVFLPAGMTYISIVGDDFGWSTSSTLDGTPPDLYLIRNVGGVTVGIPSDSDAAFVLNDAIVPIPEPSSVVLIALGLTVLSARRYRELRRSPFLTSGRGSSTAA